MGLFLKAASLRSGALWERALGTQRRSCV